MLVKKYSVTVVTDIVRNGAAGLDYCPKGVSNKMFHSREAANEILMFPFKVALQGMLLPLDY